MNQNTVRDCPPAIVPTYWLADWPPASAIPPLNPASVAERFATLAPEVLVIRYDTYIACGPAVAGELLSRVSALSLTCTMFSERGAGGRGFRSAARAARADGGSANPTRRP